MSEEPKISQRYRELPREEPPRHLDQAILAAARRAAETRPAPLVVPSGRRRWYFPLAAAAIIVLAVAVTVQMERQQPRDVEMAEAPVQQPEAKREGFVVEPPAAPAKEQREAPAAEAPARAAPAPAPASPPVAARQEQEAQANAERRALDDLRMQRRYEEPPQAQRAPAPRAKAEEAKAKADQYRADEARGAASIMAKVGARSPEQWLQGIADLRRQGRHDEADKELAEFRRSYPGYKIPEAMLGKVERPK